MTIKLYDLVPHPGGPYFSPACLRARLALLDKRVPFEVEQVTYHDLRFTWKDKLGVDKATAPFIQKEDGSYLMDSVEIALWLDAAYPDRPSIFLPEAPVPVDLNSAEYKEAVENFDKILTSPAKDESGKPAAPLWREVFTLFAPHGVKSFDKETYDYWTSDGRLGPGVWASIQQSDETATIKSVQSTLKQLSEDTLSDSVHFFSSPSKPGMKDFALMGIYGLLRSTSPKLVKATFGAPEAGRTSEWLERMNSALPTPEVWERDPKE